MSTITAPHEEVNWVKEASTRQNIGTLADALGRTGRVFRRRDGGVWLFTPGSGMRAVETAQQLAVVLADLIDIRLIKGQKLQDRFLPNAVLGVVLKSEEFLHRFKVVDAVDSCPRFLPDFTLTRPGWNDGGENHRMFYTRSEPARIEHEALKIRQFLEAMPFATEADQTNALAAALTLPLSACFPGRCPFFGITGTKSHLGKDTVADFIANERVVISVGFKGADWSTQDEIVRALRDCPDASLIKLENVRLSAGTSSIASAFLERTLTDPEPRFYSYGSGATRTFPYGAFAVTSNEDRFSTDLANRRLPIHLDAPGNVADRRPAIGNPRTEFLPANKERIAAELRGMIVNWVEAGRPLDEEARHPFSMWAQTVGGILKVAGFKHFLGNYRARLTLSDPVRKALATLAAATPGQWENSAYWASLAVKLGVIEGLTSARSRAERVRDVEARLIAHRGETFAARDGFVLESHAGKSDESRWFQFVPLATRPQPPIQE